MILEGLFGKFPANRNRTAPVPQMLMGFPAEIKGVFEKIRKIPGGRRGTASGLPHPRRRAFRKAARRQNGARRQNATGGKTATGDETATGGKAGESPSGAREKPACRAGADGGRETARVPRRFADPLRLHCRYSAGGRRPLRAPRTNAAPACAAAAGLAAAVLEFVLEPDVSGAPPDPFALPHGEACMEGMGIVPLTGKAGTRVRGGFNAPGGDRRAHDIGDGFPVQWHEDVPVPLQTGVGSRETLMEEVNALPLALPLAPCERADAPEGRVAVIPSGINPRCDEYGGSYGQFRSEGAMNYRGRLAKEKTTAKTVSRLRSLQ